MTADDTQPMLFSIDRVRVSRGRLVAWGWCLHPDGPLAGVELHLVGADRPLRAQYPLTRDDVAAHHPALRWARASGWLLLGWLPEQVRGASFYAVDAAGERHLLHSCEGLGGDLSPRQASGRLFHRAHAYVRTRQFRRLMAETATWGQRLLRRPSPPPDALLTAVSAGETPLTLVIDHAMGGGANAARDRLIDERLRHGEAMLLLTIDLSTLCYHWRLRAAELQRAFESDDLSRLPALLATPRLHAVMLNNTVGFDDPLGLNRMLVDAVSLGQIRLSFALHDYFPLCPSYALIGRHGRFCDLPDAEECAHCIAENDHPFMQLVPRRPIPEWRRSWAALLAHCDEISTFSEASAALLRRAFPELPEHNIRPRPHDQAGPALPPVPVDPRAPLHIGIVGHITYLKGAELVADLVAEIERRGLAVQITLFGELDHAVTAEHLHVLGPYQRKDLPRLIRDGGANLFLFPSIWPETFSFVVQELMAMQLPIAAFRLGAPAERLARYHRAKLIGTPDAAETLNALLDFHRALRDEPPLDAERNVVSGRNRSTRTAHYDPAEPLFFIHIPKTAGTSIRRQFYDWFGDGLLYHYFDEQTETPPARHRLREPATGGYLPGLCVFGHFNRKRGAGLEDYYSSARQRITFVRDPFERAVSTYFYINANAERWANRKTAIARVGLADWLQRPPGDMPGAFLAEGLSLDNHRAVLTERFIHIGVSEAAEVSLEHIARKLGKPSPERLPRLNATERADAVPQDLRESFLAQRPLETAIYRFALELNGLPIPAWLPPAASPSQSRTPR